MGGSWVLGPLPRFLPRPAPLVAWRGIRQVAALLPPGVRQPSQSRLRYVYILDTLAHLTIALPL